MDLFKKLYSDEEGQGLTEYALIIALISVAVVFVIIIFRNQIKSVFTTATNTMQNTA